MVTDKVSDIYRRQQLPIKRQHIGFQLFFFPTYFRHVSDIFLRHLHRHYRHYYRHITAKTIFAPTFYTDIYTDKTASTFSVHRPAANLITFAKLSQRDKNRRKGDYTLLYIGILWENSGHNVIEYQQLKRFIVQVVAFSLCKLWHFHCAS